MFVSTVEGAIHKVTLVNGTTACPLHTIDVSPDGSTRVEVKSLEIVPREVSLKLIFMSTSTF